MRIVLRRQPEFEDLLGAVPLEEGTPSEKQVQAMVKLLNEEIPGGNYTDEDVWRVVKRADPDPKQKHGSWIIKQWRNWFLAHREVKFRQQHGLPTAGLVLSSGISGINLGTFEQTDDTRETLDSFMAAKKAGGLKGPEAAIEHYKNLQELSDKIDKLEPEDFLSKRQQKKGKGARFAEIPGVQLLSSEGDFRVYEVSTILGCRFMGRGTSWCTHDPRAAKSYLEQGPLYVVTQVGKDGKESQVAQYHEDGSFRDTSDSTIADPGKYPEDFSNVITKAYGEHDAPMPTIFHFLDEVRERGWPVEENSRGWAVALPPEIDAGNGLRQRANGEAFKEMFDIYLVDMSEEGGYSNRRRPPRLGIELDNSLVESPENWNKMLEILDQMRNSYWEPADEKMLELEIEWQDAAYPEVYSAFQGHVFAELQEWVQDGIITQEEYDYHIAAYEDDNLDMHELMRGIQDSSDYAVDWQYDNDSGAWLDTQELVVEHMQPEDLRNLDGYNTAVQLRQQAGGQGQLLHKGAHPSESVAEAEGKGELTPEQEAAIIEFVKSNPSLDDDDFHKFAQSIGADPHEAEEVVYRYVQQNESLQRSLVYNSRAVELGVDLCLQNAVPFDQAVEAIVTCPQPKDDAK